MKDELVLSTLGHTWILDLDGSIVYHNGYKTSEGDAFLPGAEAFLKAIPPEDMVIFLTSRKEKCRAQTTAFLAKHDIRYNTIIFDAPYGERIVWNDRKPSGLCMSIAVDTERDVFPEIRIRLEEQL